MCQLAVSPRQKKTGAGTFECQGRRSTTEYDTFALTFTLDSKRSCKEDGA